MADKVIVCVFLVSLLTLCACRPQEWTQPREDTCGYRSCPAIKEDRLNVHLVPHTHDDVGWLKTVDQYFYGYKNNIQTAGVQYIIDSVIQELVSDPSKRFIYVEIAFFARWFREQDGAMKETVKNLVNQGRLEFILGGWCQNDEASTHYNAIIDQHELGFKFLKDNFGECGRPRVGWQVDPFGHSRELASLFARFGFDGYFFGRLDYQDKNKRLNETNMEFVWHASPNNLGKAAEIFTGVLYNGYGPPGGFCFDIGCQDDPIMDDPNLHDYNVDQKVQDFVKAAKDQAKHYRANHIMMTMGSDFQYQNAHTWYKNMDKLIKYVNEKSTEVNVLYSTPSCYLYNVNHLNQVWNSVSDDFFPYADGPHSYWTGYFTSRAALKGYVRDTNRFLQACKQLTASGGHRGEPLIEKLKEAMGVAQHHDAVSGTEKQAVADDYALRLASGRTQCEMVMNEVYSNILALGELSPPMQEFCPYLNISKCSLIDEHEDFVVLAYNPLLREVTTYLRIPVADMTYTIEDQNGTPVEHELFLIDNETLVIPERNGSKAVNEIVFPVTLPAGGFNLYIFNKPFNPPTSEPKKKKRAFKKIQAEMSIANEFLEIKFDNNGHLSQMVNRKSGTSINLQHEFMYYQGYQGNNSNNNFQASGAYIFRNNGSVQSFPSAWFKAYQPEASEKHWVEEVHLYYSGYASQVIRLYQGQPYAEVEWTVGPIDISDGVGKEIISRYTSDLNSEATFYTDSNGREMMERTRNHRKTWDLNVTEPIAGNYYPVNSRMYIRDTAKNLQLTIMTDRSQGGSSLASGQMELMVHRRLVKDDSRGVGENLNETGVNGRGLVIRGKHYLILESIDQSAAIHRDLGLRLYMAPTLSFMIGGLPYNAWIQKYRTKWTPVKTPLPPNVHLLTFDNWMGSPIEPIEDHQILLRLEHFYEANENTVLSKPATVDLSQMFDFELKIVEELTLGGNLPLANLTRLSWTSKPTGSEDLRTGEPSLKYQPAASSIITLNPMEIRTFKVMRLTP